MEQEQAFQKSKDDFRKRIRFINALDNMDFQDLYRYEGPDLAYMIKDILAQDMETNFRKVGHAYKRKIQKKRWKM
ncbi:MAG: hypothetical protein AAFP89_01720 [Bacteroidota bacterium]